jgi:hypothetical protein
MSGARCPTAVRRGFVSARGLLLEHQRKCDSLSVLGRLEGRNGWVEQMRKRRVPIAAVFTFAWLALQPVPAEAGAAWCSEDPILTFNNGARLQLLIQYDSVYSPVVAGAVTWSIQVPVDAGLITVTVPTNATHRELIALNYTGGKWGGGTNDLQIHATATVRADYAFPLLLSVNGDTSTSPMKGSSNTALTIAAHTHTGDFTAYQGVISGTSQSFTGTGSVTLP